MNIGITIHLKEENESLWINGIKLNALYLLKALKEIGYNTYLLNTSPIQSPYENKVVWDTEEFPVYDYASHVGSTDLMIYLGSKLADSHVLDFKATDKNKKAIRYICGNSYFNDLESCMFGESTEDTSYNQEFDEIWYVPQQGELNRDYYRVLHGLHTSKVRPVPFIWDPIFLDTVSEKYYTSEAVELDSNVPVYRTGIKNKDKKLACFEPNIGVQKWHINSLLIAEDYLNSGGEFKKINIFCGKGLLNKKHYSSILKNTTIFNSDPIKLSYLPRVEAIDAFSQFTDIVIAHQLGNPLNYSYLDALYLQFPLVHNASMIKDAGYYYEGNNIGAGTRQLKIAIEDHDENIDTYNSNSERVLTRYTIYNDDLLETYKQLIETTMEIKDHKLSSIYDWKTNLYK
jgi:hypothetical protein